MNNSQTQRTALITGASAGLGAEFARQLAAQGYNLVLVARREDRLQALAQELSHVTVICITADLSLPESPAQIEQSLKDRQLHIDFLVNNAGSGGPELLDGTDWPSQQTYLQLMMVSVAELCHRLIPAMCDAGFGRVVNVASVAGRIIGESSTNYGPSKAYLIALSEGMQNLRSQGVHVCALCPGFTHTEFHDQSPELKAMKDATWSGLWYDVATVVREGLKAVEAGKAICISGRLYRWLDPLLQPKWLRGLIRRQV